MYQVSEGVEVDPFVPATTIARITGTSYMRVRTWAAGGLIRVRQLEGCRMLYSIQDARKILERGDSVVVSVARDAEKASLPLGRAPAKSVRDAEWLWARLKGRPSLLLDLVADATNDGILKPGKGASLTPLYNARVRLAKLHPGWVVEVDEVTPDPRQSTRPLKRWRLARI